MTLKPIPRAYLSDWITVQEAARSLTVSKMTVSRLIDSGDLYAIRVGRSIRIHREHFDEFVRSAEIVPGNRTTGPMSRYTGAPTKASA